MQSLQQKAELLRSRRNNPPTVGFYIRQSAGRHLLFAALFWLLIAVAWWSDLAFIGWLFGGVWAGRLFRDVQWYQRLTAEWETTTELVDWQKVETIARNAGRT